MRVRIEFLYRFQSYERAYRGLNVFILNDRFYAVKRLFYCMYCIILQAFTGFVGEVPKAAEYWKEDRFFGSQFLNGCNPDSLKRCTKLPPHFPVTQKLVGNLLDSGDTLESAMAVGSY